MLIPTLFLLFVMAPAFAAWEQQAADRRAEALAEEVRRELAEGRPVREAPPERKLVFWPYALLAIGLSATWTLANTEAGDDSGLSIGIGVAASIMVWIVFNIFIFTKRTNAHVSLLTLAVMIGTSAGLASMADTNPLVAEVAHRLR